MIGLLIDIIFLSVAITYIVKFYKYRNMAEKEFINYENRLAEEESKRKEEEYIHESEMHLYKEEYGEMTPENEGVRIEKKKLQDELGKNQGQDGNIDLQPFLNKIEKIYKEKELEREKRADAESQLALALQQNQEIEQRIEDFRVIQEDNTNMIKKISANLYRKISSDLQKYLK